MIHPDSRIEKTARGHTIHPSVWGAPLIPARPDAIVERGRLVAVTFIMIAECNETRAALDEHVTDELRGLFDLKTDPILDDLCLRTDKPQLMEQVLSAGVTEVVP